MSGSSSVGGGVVGGGGPGGESGGGNCGLDGVGGSRDASGGDEDLPALTGWPWSMRHSASDGLLRNSTVCSLRMSCNVTTLPHPRFPPWLCHPCVQMGKQYSKRKRAGRQCDTNTQTVKYRPLTILEFLQSPWLVPP